MTELHGLERYLPDSMQAMLEFMSIEAVMALVEARGGTRIGVPQTAIAGHWLEELLGPDEFGVLVKRMSGARDIQIPRCQKLLEKLRDARLLADRRAGLSCAALAIKYKMTESGVHKALRRIEKQELAPWVRQRVYEQLDIFADAKIEA